MKKNTIRKIGLVLSMSMVLCPSPVSVFAEEIREAVQDAAVGELDAGRLLQKEIEAIAVNEAAEATVQNDEEPPAGGEATEKKAASLISLGGGYSAAIDTDGNLWIWGWNKNGYLGDGTTMERHSPVKIMEGTKFRAVSLGGRHSAAIDASGNLWTWGWNINGYLGDGTTTERHSPVKIMEGTKFQAVSLGGSHSAAIDASGNLWTWGYNSFGQLGDGTATTRPTPAKIMEGTKFQAVSLGEYHSVAIDASGNLWTWGNNGSGNLGDGTTTPHYAPMKIMEGTTFQAVSLENWDSAAIDADGNLWTWGDNSFGQLGDGTTTDRHSPVKITQFSTRNPSNPSENTDMDIFVYCKADPDLTYGKGFNTVSFNMNIAPICVPGINGVNRVYSSIRMNVKLGDGLSFHKSNTQTEKQWDFGTMSLQNGYISRKDIYVPVYITNFKRRNKFSVSVSLTADGYNKPYDTELSIPVTITDNADEIIVDEGECGQNARWKLITDGTLIIFGKGEMRDYTGEAAPWEKHSDKITGIIVEEGITQIGKNAFASSMADVSSVSIPTTVLQIKETAFKGCSSLNKLIYPDPIVYIWSKIHIEAGNANLINVAQNTIKTQENIVLPFHTKFRNTLDEPIGIRIPWNIGYFNIDSSKFNSNLALAALILSNDAYAMDRAEESMKKLHLISGKNGRCIRRYEKDEERSYAHPGAVYGYNKIILGGTPYNLFTVTIRGTSGGNDVETDFKDGIKFFPTSTDNTLVELLAFMKVVTGVDDLDQLKEESNIFFLTGHSLGGAISNRLSVLLGEYADDNRIYNYTFEAPNTVWYENPFERPQDEQRAFQHNVVNQYDFVPYLPTAANSYEYASKYGKVYPFNPMSLDSEVFKLVSGGISPDLVPNTLFYRYGLRDWIYSFCYHWLDWDLAYLLELGSVQTNMPAMDYARKTLFRIACPVDVQLYVDDKLISETVDTAPRNYDLEMAEIFVLGDEKYVLIHRDADYKIIFKGTDNGKMDYSVSQYDWCSGEYTEIKDFHEVQLAKDKVMSSEVETGSLSSNKSKSSGIYLYIMNQDDQEIEKEIQEDGTETAVKVRSVSLNSSERSVNIGETIYLSSNLVPAFAANKNVSWKSGNPQIASVDGSGVVTGISKGVTYIEVTAEDGGHTASCNLIVKDKSSDQPDNPDDPDIPEYDDWGDGIFPGDLPEGKKVPEGIWIGGLKKKYVYTGNAIKPDFRVYYGGKRLAPKLDYAIAYKKNTNPGTDAQVVLSFRGDFTGTMKASFEIEKNPLSPGTVSADALAVAYKKGRKNNTVKPVLVADDGTVLKYTPEDFYMIYTDAKTGEVSDCEDAGEYNIHMTSKGDSRRYAFTASIDVPLFVKEDVPVMSGVKVMGRMSLKYAGEKLLPKLTLKYAGQKINSRHYSVETVSGDNYTDPGSHVLILKGDGVNVFGTKRITYKITGKRKLGDNKYTSVMLSPESLDAEGKVPYAYGGAKPEVIVSYNGVRLKKGRDYAVSYRNNKEAGSDAVLTVKGTGGYAGTVAKEFKVSKRDLKDLVLIVNDLAESNTAKDYEKASLLFFTKDSFADQKLKKADYTTAFTVSSDSTTPKAGDTVSVNIVAKPGGNYKGTATASYKIIGKSKDISKAKVVINGGKAYGYTGKEIKPAGGDVEVKLKGSSVSPEKYELIYFNNVDRGSAAVWIKGKNGCGGGRVVRFRIGGSKAADMWDGVLQAAQGIRSRAWIRYFHPAQAPRKIC